jgi:hypothetical protein
MMNDEFPTKYGFKYNEDYDEWQKTVFDGILILWEKPNSIGIWEMSFCDENDQLHSILIGDEDYIIEQIIIIGKTDSIYQFIDKQN